MQAAKLAGVGELAQMVAFEMERHVPFQAEEMRFDWKELPGKADGPLRVLVLACERLKSRFPEASPAELAG